MCAWLLDARTYPYPYGAYVEPDWLDAVRPSAALGGSWWADRRSYLEDHRADDGFTGADPP